jgi:hypothetical protein
MLLSIQGLNVIVITEVIKGDNKKVSNEGTLAKPPASMSAIIDGPD